MIEPYFETELGKLYHGDCLEIMPMLEPVDLVLTDIPYGAVNRESQGLRSLDKGKADIETFQLSEFLPIITSRCKGSLYIFCGTEQVSEIRKYLVQEKFSTRLGIWEKTNPSPMNGQHIWLSGLECFVYGKLKGGIFNDFCRNPIIRNQTARNQLHETQKPTGVFQDIIITSSAQCDTVLDPCFGSGTTGLVCENLNRYWIGIEIEEKYCEIAARRIEKENQQLKLF